MRRERKYVEEVGTMNMFFVIDDEVITAPLNGSILPGITRDSVLQIVRRWGMKVSERSLSIDEVIAGPGKRQAQGVIRHRDRSRYIARGTDHLSGTGLCGGRRQDG